ncbi:MAG: hypothetical protein KDA56_09220 [Hyphomonas sp.]|nr:hypothetical protein [Hyphomonas sp.]
MPGNFLSTPEFRRLVEAANSVRRRSQWNDRLSHWEKPASVSEEGTILRAENNVKSALATDPWFAIQQVEVAQQGSYFNNTNVRTEADIDIRVVHPNIQIEYGAGVTPQEGWQAMGYQRPMLSNEDASSELRQRIRKVLEAKFGVANVKVGTKAIKVSGITGSRADVDVVPVTNLHFLRRSTNPAYLEVVEGVALLPEYGDLIFNFPKQHHSNGIAKRTNTKHRFKKVVRSTKRMRADMAETYPVANRIPSFLVECLIYLVEDEFFCVEEDDRYLRLKRVLGRLSTILASPTAEITALEINDVKLLFGPHQPWELREAREFVRSALEWMGE